MNTVDFMITVKLITGQYFCTDWSQETPEALEVIREALYNVGEMGKFKLTTCEGYTLYINPAHIVYAYVETK